MRKIIVDIYSIEPVLNLFKYAGFKVGDIAPYSDRYLGLKDICQLEIDNNIVRWCVVKDASRKIYGVYGTKGTLAKKFNNKENKLKFVNVLGSKVQIKDFII